MRRAWFPGETDLDQLGKIFQALGTPNQDTWPGCAALPQFVEFQATTAPPLRNTFRQVTISRGLQEHNVIIPAMACKVLCWTKSQGQKALPTKCAALASSVVSRGSKILCAELMPA